VIPVPGEIPGTGIKARIGMRGPCTRPDSAQVQKVWPRAVGGERDVCSTVELSISTPRVDTRSSTRRREESNPRETGLEAVPLPKARRQNN